MGDRVGAVQCELSPLNSDLSPLNDFIAEFTYFDTTEVAGIVDNAEAVKGFETRKVQRLHLDKWTCTNGPSM